MLRVLVLALALIALAPPPASSAACPPADAALYTPYPDTAGHRSPGVRVLDQRVHEEGFIWTSTVSAGLWLETNGLQGLQRTASQCGPADTHVVGATAPTRGPMIPL